MVKQSYNNHNVYFFYLVMRGLYIQENENTFGGFKRLN